MVPIMNGAHHEWDHAVTKSGWTLSHLFNQFASDAVQTRKFCLGRPVGEHLYTHCDFCVFCWKTGKHATCGVSLWRLTCIHAIVSRSPWESRLGGPRQKALQAMNTFTLFVDFCLLPLSKTCAFDIPAKNL